MRNIQDVFDVFDSGKRGCMSRRNVKVRPGGPDERQGLARQTSFGPHPLCPRQCRLPSTSERLDEPLVAILCET
jgi:hypothetical protein